MRPHRRQPTRLLCPWDFPGKSTGVGCHCLLQCMKVKSESEVTQSCLTPSDPMDCSLLGSSVHGIFQARVLEWGRCLLQAPTLDLTFSCQALPQSHMATLTSTLLTRKNMEVLCRGRHRLLSSHKALLINSLDQKIILTVLFYILCN